MTRTTRPTLIAAALLAAMTAPLAAQQGHPHLHVNPRWKECSIQLDASLTLPAWKQFTEEAGLVAYFRPLTDARPMGKGKFELSMVQYGTEIDDHTAAWNDTFVHPDSAHWLFEGNGLKFPGFVGRLGLTDRTDVGFYFTKNPNANYGFYGAQAQHAFLNPETTDWGLAVRGSFNTLYGPADVDFTVLGIDVVASRTFGVNSWISISPYAGFSDYLTHSHEKSSLVNLADQTVVGSSSMLGAAVQVSKVKLSMEWMSARVRSTSLKIGFGL